MEICSTCPHLDKEGTNCMVHGTQPCCALCGCSLGFKTRSLSSKCDDKRWFAEVTPEEDDAINEQIEKDGTNIQP